MATTNRTNPRIKIFKFPFVYLIAVLACCLFLPACTVHKKLNENGYGVFWKKSTASKTPDESVHESSNSSDTTPSTTPTASVDGSFVLKHEIRGKDNSRLDVFSSSIQPFKTGAIDAITEDSYAKFSQKNQGVLPKKEANTNNQKQHSTKDPVQRVEKMAKTALLLGLLSSPLSYLVGLGSIPALVSLVLAAISLRKIKKNPSIYAENAKLNARIALLMSLASICMIGSVVFFLAGVVESSSISFLASVILSGFSIFAAFRSVSSKHNKADYPTFRIIASILIAGLSAILFLGSFLLMLHTA